MQSTPIAAHNARMVAILIGACALSACAPGPDSSKDDDSGAIADDGGAGDGGGGDGASTDGVSPSILEADVWCYPHADGDATNYFWSATLVYTDPQGDNTIENFYTDGVLVQQGGAEVARYALACRDGVCLASWSEAEDLVACGNAEAYTIVLTIADEDGNLSTPAERSGRQGADPSGR
jgi:hypothetical protein